MSQRERLLAVRYWMRDQVVSGCRRNSTFRARRCGHRMFICEMSSAFLPQWAITTGRYRWAGLCCCDTQLCLLEAATGVWPRARASRQERRALLQTPLHLNGSAATTLIGIPALLTRQHHFSSCSLCVSYRNTDILSAFVSSRAYLQQQFERSLTAVDQQ